MLYMYNEQDEQNFKVGFKIHLLPKPCPFYHPFSLRKIVSFDFVSMVNCKFLCVWGILFPFLWLLMRSLYFVKKLHVNVIFSPIILNVIFLFHYLFKIKKKNMLQVMTLTLPPPDPRFKSKCMHWSIGKPPTSPYF